jgi:O-antigen/teichoic acid export membrane protein
MIEGSANNKRIAKNTMMLYIRMLFSMGVGLYTSRVVLAVLGVDDFGIYSVVGGLVAMFSLLHNSFSSAIQRYMTFELGAGNKERLKNVFTSSVNILFVISSLIFILAETVGLWFLNVKMNIPDNRMVAANWVYQLSLLTFIFNVVSVPYNAAITAHEDFKVYARISMLEVLLKLGVALCLTISLSVDKLIFYSILLSGVAVIIRLCYGFYCTKHYEECKYSRKIDIPLFKEMFAFSGWTFIGSSAFILKTQGISIILNLFFGVVVNAAQAIAAHVQVVVTAFTSSFTMAVNPQITKLYAINDFARMNNLVLYASRVSFFLILIFIVPICMETEYILNIWLKYVPRYAVIFTQLVLFNVLIDTLSNTFHTVVLATKKISTYQSVIGGISLLNLPISYLLLKLGHEPYITMMVSCVLSLIMLLARLYIARKKVPFPIGIFFKQVIFRVSVVSLCVIIVLRLFKSHVFLLSIYNITIELLVTILLVWILGINKRERSMVLNYIEVYGHDLLKRLRVHDRCKF